jgi:hypothetical protein
MRSPISPPPERKGAKVFLAEVIEIKRVNILNLKLLIEIYMPNNIETTLKTRKKEKIFKT